MNIKEQHRHAIELAKLAKLELDNNNLDEYNRLINEAYLLEKATAEFYKDKIDIEPTRSILYRSAATLAFKCEKYTEAINLITQALLGNPFEEIKIELLDLLKQSVGLRTDFVTPQKSNDYLQSLRDSAVNIKIEEKTGKYAGAFIVSDVIEVLKNLDLSYQNYGEAKFSKTIDHDSLPDFDYTLNKFKGQCSLLGVNTNFSSFGISISVDKSVMDHFAVYTDEFKEMKNNLFAEFKEDVLLPKYDDPNFQERITNKFTEEERRKIFTPIVSTISKNKGYKLTITDDNYQDKIKVFTPITNIAKEKLIPKAPQQIINTDVQTSLVKKLEQQTGNKKTIINTEEIKYYELEVVFNELAFDKKTAYFNDKHYVLIIYEMNYYRIDDDNYQIHVTDKEYHNLLALYSKYFINTYVQLLDRKQSLSMDEIELLNLLESTTMRDW